MITTTLPAALTIRRALGDEAEIDITTPARDLMGETVDPMGMDLRRYLDGTRAVKFTHDYNQLPVGKTVSLAQTPRGIRARFRWLDANPAARVVRDVFAEGVLGASVEFVPVERETNRSGAAHWAKSILTGWALTANPANPECVRMMKSLGLAHADAPVLLVTDDADDPITVEPQALVAAFREVAARQSRLRRAAEPIVFRLVDEPAAEEEETYLVDPAAVKAATEAFVEQMIDREVRAAVNFLRGKVD